MKSQLREDHRVARQACLMACLGSDDRETAIRAAMAESLLRSILWDIFDEAVE